MMVALVTSVKIKFLTTLFHPRCHDSELLNIIDYVYIYVC